MSTLLRQSEADTSYALSFYTVGGTLRSDAPSYVERPADIDLYNNLTRGVFCYALGQRQMGKSSLMVRTAARLRTEGVAVAVLDLTAIGLNISAEQWYGGLLARIGEQLHLEDELDDYWLDHTRLSPLQRWMAALKKVVLRMCAGNVVIFIDEVDAVVSLPFPTDEFFAGIRELYNRRTDEPELRRLTFCLLGVATPSDLVRDIRITPFNIGKRIDLTDFTEREATHLSKGLSAEPDNGRELIKRVIYWTGGHPYLTQQLCHALSEEAGPKHRVTVDRVCERQFFSSSTREQNDNLQVVSNRILRGDADIAGLLDLYERVRRYNGVGEPGSLLQKEWHRLRRVRVDETSQFVSVLWLSSIVRITNGCLYVRNRIYHRVFDEEWVRDSMPDAELRRQRRAYRKGLLRAAIIAAIVILLILALGIYGLVQRNQVNLLTEEAQRLAGFRDWQEDLLIWELIKLDTNPATFQAYLEVNPPPEYASLAMKKIEALRHSSASQLKGVIRGHVFDVDTKKPIMGATITAKNQEHSSEQKMFSNEYGEFMLPLLPVGLYTITIEGPGYEKNSLKDFPVIAERINRITPEIDLRKE